MKVENIDDTKNIDTRSAVQAYLGQQTDPAQSAHQSFATSVGTNPDYEVELRRVAAQTGVPVDSARAYPDEVKRKAQLEAVDFQAMQAKYPTTVNFIADRNNAQVAHDDLDGLQGVEDTLKPADRTFLEGLWQPIASGWNATVAGFGLTMGDALTPSGLEAKRKLAAEQGGVDYTPDIERAVKQAQLERTAQKYSAPADIQKGMQEIGGAQTFGYALEAALSNPRATLETALQSLGASAPALLMATGGATLGPAGTATGAGLGSFSIEYASTVRDVMTSSGINMTDPVQLADGLNNSELMSQAREKAIKRGIPIAVFDALTAGMAGRLLAGAAPSVLSGAARGAGELGIQAGGGAAGEATAQAVTGEYKPGDILMEALAELPSALVEVPSNYRTLAAKAQAAEVQAARIEQITKTAQASKLAQRDADTFEKFVAAAKEEGPVQDVYIDAQALMQSGVAEQVAAASPAVADQLPAAAATGGVIRIPVEEYAARIAPTELSQSLIDHLRTEPEGFSRAEAQQFMQTQQEQLQNEMEKAVKAQEGDAAFKTERDAIAAQVRDQLDTVGRFSPEVHDAYATMIGNFFAVQGAKLGVSPQELFNRTGFSVAGSMAEGPQLEATQGQPLQQAETLRAITKGLKDSGVSVAATERDGAINLAKIVVPETERGTGKGTAAMQALLDYADRTGQRIELTPSADFGGNKKRLVDFYKRLGFVENKGAAKDFTISEAMYRPAQQVKTLQQADLESEAFKNWFGDSDNVDDDGRPLIYYHDSRTQFSGVEQGAGKFGGIFALKGRPSGYGPVSTPLIIRGHVLSLDELATELDGKEDEGLLVLEKALGHTLEGEDDLPLLVEALTDGGNYPDDPRVWELLGAYDEADAQVAIQRLRGKVAAELGFGAVQTPDEFDGDTVMVTDPGLIKSVENKGNFDPNNPNILEQKARGMFNPETNVITLLKNADLSKADYITDVGQLTADEDSAYLAGDLLDVGAQITPDGFVRVYHRTSPAAAEAIRKTGSMTGKEDGIFFSTKEQGQAEGFGDAVVELLVPLNKLQLDDMFDDEAHLRLPLRRIGEKVNVKSWLATPAKTLQQADLESEAFKNWFGDSKVVDAEGNPLVVYHGTYANFDQFDPKLSRDIGIHFGTIGQAQKFGDRLLPVYLTIKNPIRVEDNFSRENGLGAFLEDIYYEIDATSKETDKLRELAAAVERGWSDDRDADNTSIKEFKQFWKLALKILTRSGYDGIVYRNRVEGDGDSYVVFDPSRIKSAIGNRGTFDPNNPNILEQKARGMFNPETNVITLLKNADLSTFLHESGHFFLEQQFALTNQLGPDMSAAQQELAKDTQALLNWFGVQDLDTWYAMDFEEQRSYHEKFAQGFEKYLFEGKAPSIELQPLFQRFAAWLKSIYRDLTRLKVELTPEVRGVLDRMLATNDQIALAEQARSMMPLFETPEKAGMTPEEFAAYQAQDVEASAEALQDMQARGLRDMQYIHNARGREIKRLQKEARAARTEVRMEVAKQVMAEPVYQAWQFLTGKISAEDKARLAPPPKEKAKEGVDPSRDSLFTAIAKLGGINKEALIVDGWIDPVDNPKSGVFGKPVVRKNGGKTLDGMLEALGEQGYVPVDKNGKGDLADLEAAFSAELSGDPQYSVWYNYENDLEMLPGEGANVYELTNGRLDLGSLRLDFSVEVVDKLVARRMTAVNGIHHDLIAEKFGFASGDELTRALAETSSPSEEIEGITDRVMLERYGELATPEAIEKAADKAIHNTVRGRMLATEANALARMTGQRKVLRSAAKELAGKLVGRLKIADLRPQLYVTAEGKAGRAADAAFRKGDTQQAAAEKRNQLVNHELARTAYDAQDEVIKIDRFFKRIVTTPDDKLKSRDMDVVNAARAVLASFGYGAKAKNAAEYLSKVQEYDPAMYEVLAASVVAAQEIAQGDVKQLTVDQLRALNDEVSSLWYLSKRVRQMEIDGDLMDREDVAEQLQARMVEVGLPSSMPGEVSAVTPDEERAMRIASVKAVMRRVESWVDMMDGSNKLGVFRRYLWTPIKEAADQYRADRVSYLRQFRDTFSDIAQTMKRGLIVAPELNYTFGKDSAGVAMNEILHAILHTGNASNKRKLLLGRGWAQEQPDGTLDTSRWDSFINRMVAEGKLVKEHFDFAQKAWDLLEQTKPLAQKAHRAAYGKYFDEVTAEAFTDPFGVVRRGGYAPAQVDSRIVKDNELKKLIEEGKEGMAYAFPGTSKGFTMSRTEYNRPLLLDLRTLPQHIDKVLLFSHMELPSRDAAKLLYTKGLSSSLNKFDPAAITGMLMPWLNRSARQQVTTPIAGAGWMMRMLNTLRNRTSMATMFANISNTAQQITGFSLAALKVRPSSLAASTAAYLRAPKRTAEEVAELSVFMRNRMSNEVDAMMGEIQGILLDPNAFEKAQEWAKRHTYFMQSAFDNVMGPIIWRAAYSEALEQNFNTKDAVRIADAAIRQTQGSTMPEDVSRIETGPAYARLFTQFVGYFNMQANLLGTEFAKMAQEMGVRKGMGRGLYITLLGFYIPAMVAELVAQAFRGGPGDDDKDGDYLDDWLMATLVYGPMRNATAFVPFAGQVINSAVARFNGNPNDDKMSMSPAVSAIEAAVGVPFDLYKSAIGEGNAQRTVKDVATLISLTTGIPASVAARPISYLAGVEQRTIQPTSAPDLVRGLATGAASPESKGR